MASEKTPAVISAGVVLITITTLAMGSRMTARQMYKTMGFDDVLILISWILSLALCACVMTAMQYGLGHHHDNVSAEDYQTFLKFIFNLITDLILFIEPIPSTWKLQLPLVKKLGFISMLSLGLLVTVISVIRIVYVTGIRADDTYELVNPLIWSMVEICALIICSSIPSVKQVAAKTPILNHLLGISSLGDSFGPSRNKKKNSIPLDSQSNRGYAKSQKSRTLSIQRSNPFGMTSHVTAAAMEDAISENGSQDEIFPHKEDENGVIRVTTEVKHNVESGAESARHFSDLTSRHRHELKRIVERQRSNHVSTSKGNSSGDKKWFRRSG
ncbi:hypothetical protein ABKA04_002663 [Annulohypoxylon sp. FPYF3050]